MPGYRFYTDWPRCPECGGLDFGSVGVIHHRRGCSQDPDGEPGQTLIPLEPRKLAEVRKRDRMAPEFLRGLRRLRSARRVGDD